MATPSSCRPSPPTRRTARASPLNTTLAIVLAAGLVGGAIIFARKREDEEGAGVCSQLAAVDPKLGAACAGLPLLGDAVKRLGALAEGAGSSVAGAAGAVADVPRFLGEHAFGGGCGCDCADLNKFDQMMCCQDSGGSPEFTGEKVICHR